MVGFWPVFTVVTIATKKPGFSPTVVPVHGNKTLKTGTQRDIMKYAGLTEKDL
jgi:hypothetical protein